MTTGSSNELMQEGIRHVREGRMGQAYLVFKKVIERDPRNEFAQIWISVTSEDRGEKRAALEKALEINPNSQHAKEALRILNAEEKAASDSTTQDTVQLKNVTPPPSSPETPADISENPNTLPPIGRDNTPSQPPRIGDVVSNPFVELPHQLREEDSRAAKDVADTKPYRLGQLGEIDNRTFPPRLGSRETNTSPLPVLQQTSITSKDKRPKVDPVAAEDKAADTTKKRERLFLKRIRVTGFVILTIVVLLLVGFLVYNALLAKPNNQQQANQTTPNGQSSATTAADTAATQTTQAVTTTAPVSGSPTASSTTGGTTTGAVTTAAQTTQASITQSAVAKNLQSAKESQDKGDLKGAITAYQAALQTDANNVTANLALGTLFMTVPDTALPTGTNRYEAAAQSFKLVASQNPNWAGGYSRLGEALSLQGNVKDAITAYSRSLELDPNGPERWLALAALYDKDNQPDQARFCRERAGSIAPATLTPAPAPTSTPAPTNTPVPPSPTT